MNNKDKVRTLLQAQREYLDKVLGMLGDELEPNDQEDVVLKKWELIWILELSPAYNKANSKKLDEIGERLVDIEESLANNKFNCAYSERKNESIELIVAPSAPGNKTQVRQEALREIRDFTADAHHLIIIDPYFFATVPSLKDHISDFKRSSRIDKKKLAGVHIIYSSKHGNNKAVKAKIKQLAEENNCPISTFDSDLIHDRIWIKNKSEGIVIGTSFGGIGNRLCFILRLPDDDLEKLFEFLQKGNMITHLFR